MTNISPIPRERTLHSWKEIATYTGRGVRTIQRYELKLGFPIRRPAGTPRSAVLAFPHEIDEWLAKSPMKIENAPEPSAKPKPADYLLRESLDVLFQRARAQMERATVMAKRMQQTQLLLNRMKAFVKINTQARHELRTRSQANHTILAGIRTSGGCKIVSGGAVD